MLAPWAERQLKTLATKVVSGQKQSVSVFEEQPRVKSQVLRQEGRTEGQGACVTAATVEVGMVVGMRVVGAGVVMTGEVEAARVVVRVLVNKTVEVELVVSMWVVSPVVWVRVTGQMVVEVSMLLLISLELRESGRGAYTTVVMTSLGAGTGVECTPAALEVVEAAGVDTAGELATGVVPAVTG